MNKTQNSSKVNKITGQELEDRKNTCMKYLSESIAKKYNMTTKSNPDKVITKMAESVAAKGRKTQNNQDLAIRKDFGNLDQKINQNQGLLNEWGGLAGQRGNNEPAIHNDAQARHNASREEVANLKNHYNQDPSAYNKNFSQLKNEHIRLNQDLDQKIQTSHENIERLKRTNVQHVQQEVVETHRNKEIRNSNVRNVAGAERVVNERRYEQVTKNTRRAPQNTTPTHNVQYKGDIGIEEHNPNFISSIVDKEFEIVVEKPVITERIVEVPYEVIVEKPVENYIEKEVIYERVVEKPIERIIEREVEEIVHQEKEVIVHQEVVTERVVEVPRERIVNKNVEVIVNQDVEVIQEVERTVERRIARPRREELQIKETIVEHAQFVDEVVERRVNKPYTTYKDVEEIEYFDKEYIKNVDKIIEIEKFKDVEVVHTNVVEDIREEIIHKTIDKPVTKYVDVDEIHERRVRKPVRKTVRKEIEIDVVNQRDEYVDRKVYVDKYVDVIVQRHVPIEKIVEVEKTVDVIEEIQVPTRREILVEKEIEVEQLVYRKIAKYVEKPVEKYVDCFVDKPVTIFVDEEVIEIVTIDKKIPKIVEREVVVEVPVTREVDRIVEIEKIIEVPVYVDKIVRKEIPKVVEKIVEVKIPKYKEIKVEKEREKIIEQIVEIENPVYVEQDNTEIINIMDTGKNERLRKSYRANQDQISDMHHELQQLEQQAESARKMKINRKNEFKMTMKTGPTTVIGKEENNFLREELDDLHQKYAQVMEKSQQYDNNQQIVAQNNQRRSVRRSLNPPNMEQPKKSVVRVENDEKKIFTTNKHGQRVEMSQGEYERMKSESKSRSSYVNNGGYTSSSQVIHQGGHQGRTETVTNTSYRQSQNRTSYVNTRPSQNQTSYVNTRPSQNYTSELKTSTYQDGRMSTQQGEQTYFIRNENGDKVKISASEYHNLQRKSGIN